MDRQGSRDFGRSQKITKMKDLVFYLIASITGSKEFEVEEKTEGDQIELDVKTKKDIIGLIIGKEGKTIKNIRKILSIKATLEKKIVNINVTAED